MYLIKMGHKFLYNGDNFILLKFVSLLDFDDDDDFFFNILCIASSRDVVEKKFQNHFS